jgi:hypothetical protein
VLCHARVSPAYTLSFSLSPSVRPSVRPPVPPSLSACRKRDSAPFPFLYIISRASLSLSLYSCIYLCIYLSMYLCIHVSMYLSIYLYIYIYIVPCLPAGIESPGLSALHPSRRRGSAPVLTSLSLSLVPFSLSLPPSLPPSLSLSLSKHVQTCSLRS